MALSYERRWAKLVNSYARLKGLYEKSQQRERLLVSQLQEARYEIRDLKRFQREKERASKNTMERLFATTRYAISHLHDAGDLVASEKLEIWLEQMEDSMQPVANVNHLLQLLDEWSQAMPFDDVNRATVVWMKTRMMLAQLRGQDGTEANG